MERLEKVLGENQVYFKKIGRLKDMIFKHTKGAGYIPCYTRTELTDALHEAFGFRTDHEIVTQKQMKSILKMIKSG